MCKNAPCLATPFDVITLMNAGYSDYLAPTCVASPNVIEHFGKPINAVALLYDKEKGACCMLDDDGKCKLHESGLKPLEGKLANCNIPYIEETHPMFLILDIWLKLELK